MITSKRSKSILISLLVSFFVIALVLISFKKIRSILPPPEIGPEKLVGFSQYYGYPVYYDTVVFFLLVFIPVPIFIFIYEIFTRNEKQK